MIKEWWNKRSNEEKVLIGIVGGMISWYLLHKFMKSSSITDLLNKLLREDFSRDIGLELYDISKDKICTPDRLYLLKYVNSSLIKITEEEAKSILTSQDPGEVIGRIIKGKRSPLFFFIPPF